MSDDKPTYPAVASVPPRPEDVSAMLAQMNQVLAEIRATQQQPVIAQPIYPAHTPPSVADIGGMIAASGVAPERVGPLVAATQAEIVGAMVRVVKLITDEMALAHRNQMAGFAAILQSTSVMGFGSQRDALVRLLLTPPDMVNDTLLAARYDGRTDWRDALPNQQR